MFCGLVRFALLFFLVSEAFDQARLVMQMQDQRSKELELQRPKFRSDVESLPEGSPIEEIHRLDASMSGPDKAKRIGELMEPSRNESFESQGHQYYFYGPFASRDELIEAVKDDPMLKPVYDKWSKFDTTVLDAMFKYGVVYLQIRWEGWFVRPVLEMTQEQFSSLCNQARSELN